MPRTKVLVADSSESRRPALKTMLSSLGYQVLGEAKSVPDLLRKTRDLEPDVVLFDLKLEGGSPLEAAQIIEYDDLASIVVIASSNNPDVRDFHYCIYPFTETSLMAAVDAALLYRKRTRELRKEIQKLRETLETRKTVDKAKALLMKNAGIGEEEAHRLIQKQSMNKGIPLKEVAEAIILAYEIQESGKRRGE